MLGVSLVTFDPDLAFTAASVFITSDVPRLYQGSVGSLLIVIQNPSAAIINAIENKIWGLLVLLVYRVYERFGGLGSRGQW